MGQFKIIQKEIKDEILTKVKSGERVMVLAKQYGVSDKSIYTWLRQTTGEQVVSIVKYNKLKRENEELKRLVGDITLKMSLGEKIELIKKGEIKKVRADALGINRKNIYHKPLQKQKDLLLKQQIEETHKIHPSYGHKRLGMYLRVNHKRILRIMKKFGIKPPRRKVKNNYCTKLFYT